MNVKMNGNKVVKSIVLAGVLSIGVFTGGHISDAAGHGNSGHEAKTEHAVNVKHSKSQATVHAKVKVEEEKPEVEKVKAETKKEKKAKVVKQNKSAANKAKSQASVRASKIAKQHASLKSAVRSTETAVK